MKRNSSAELLEVFGWAEALAQATLGNLLRGYYGRGDAHVISHLRRQKLITAKGRGAQAEFTLTEQGRKRVRVSDPEAHWRREWDGAWRVVTFDLPETRRGERKLLWQALRAHRLGLLQRSVWIWPHDVTELLREIIAVEGVPECFCGFKATGLFLCTSAEIVRSAWAWTEILRRQQQYLRAVAALERAALAAKGATRLGQVARMEKQLHEQATVWDPLLPQSLWPPGYHGREVHQKHQRWLLLLRACLSDLSHG